MCQLFARLLVLPNVFLPHPKRQVPVVASLDPPLMPLLVINLAGLENRRRLDEVFDLHLLEFASPKDKIARGNLVPKRFADLRYPKRQLLVCSILDVLEIDEYTLRCL